jgi:hypothetical protein
MSPVLLFFLGAIVGGTIALVTKEMQCPQAGRVVKLTNQDPKFGADAVYWGVWVKREGGKLVHWLLTEEDILRLSERSAKNPEDRA